MNDQSEEPNKLVEYWAVADLRGDTASLGSVLADDFVGVGPRAYARSSPLAASAAFEKFPQKAILKSTIHG